jgi:hypothetical protein
MYGNGRDYPNPVNTVRSHGHRTGKITAIPTFPTETPDRSNLTTLVPPVSETKPLLQSTSII